MPEQRSGEFLGHPKGLYVLSLTEMWERFSFYSMRAFLVLYMTKALVLSDKLGNEIYGAYLGFVYASPFIGGMLADRLLGQRRSIVIGGLLMAAAQFTLAAHSILLERGADVQRTMFLFFVALGLLSAGNGFFKPNISTIVGSLYPAGDKRRDNAFLIFYMGINIGAFLAGFSGQVAEMVHWKWGFLMAGTGMLVGQVIFWFGGRQIGPHGHPPQVGLLSKKGPTGLPNGLLLAFGVALFIPISAYLMSRPSWVQYLAVVVAVPILMYLVWEILRAPRGEGARMAVIVILCSFSMLFWAFFELAGSAINLFTDKHVDRTINFFGREIELGASLLTAQINPVFIILLGIPFGKLWVWLDKRQAEPSSPLKFALGLLQLGAGFFVMYLGALDAREGGTCSIWYLTLGFFLHTTGELCLSPVGLSTVTKLSPVRLVGMFMGVWFLSSSLGNVFGGWVGGKTENYGFDVVFKWIGVVCVGAAVLLFVLVPLLKRMMRGVK